jgi:hypothetical protein
VCKGAGQSMTAASKHPIPDNDWPFKLSRGFQPLRVRIWYMFVISYGYVIWLLSHWKNMLVSWGLSDTMGWDGMGWELQLG